MEKRTNDQKRPLCVAEDNTCQNLAGSKGMSKKGVRLYHTKCDRHRRDGHDAKAFRNPTSKRYLPLDKCELCNEKATDRHRIIQGDKYSKDNVLCICKGCHRKVHILYQLLKLRKFDILRNAR